MQVRRCPAAVAPGAKPGLPSPGVRGRSLWHGGHLDICSGAGPARAGCSAGQRGKEVSPRPTEAVLGPEREWAEGQFRVGAAAKMMGQTLCLLPKDTARGSERWPTPPATCARCAESCWSPGVLLTNSSCLCHEPQGPPLDQRPARTQMGPWRPVDAAARGHLQSS